jgi:DNA repair protein SbcC/Rad50
MIDSITLKNFQKHKRLEIQFDPHITVLVGRSKAGKSTVLRALRWAILNQPSGVKHVRHGATAAKVKLEIGEDTIIRQRGEKNTYSLNGKVFVSFGAGVPDEIKAVLQMDGSNFQTQFEPHFWLTQSPSQVAAALNDLAGLSNIDTAFSYVILQVKQAKAQVDACKARIKLLRASIRGLQWVGNARQCLDSINTIEKEVERVSETRHNLKNLVEKIEKAQLALQAKKTPDLSPLESMVEKVRVSKDRKKRLNFLLSQIQDSEDEQCQRQTQLHDAREKLQKLSKGNCPVCGQPTK